MPTGVILPPPRPGCQYATRTHIHKPWGHVVRLFASDESSTSTGLAFFEGSDIAWTKRVWPPAGRPWRQRMRWIAEQLQLALELFKSLEQMSDLGGASH